MSNWLQRLLRNKSTASLPVPEGKLNSGWRDVLDLTGATIETQILNNPDFPVVYSGNSIFKLSGLSTTISGTSYYYGYPIYQLDSDRVVIANKCRYCGTRKNFDEKGFCKSCGAPVSDELYISLGL